MNVEEEIQKILSEQLTKEINKEIIKSIMKKALPTNRKNKIEKILNKII